MIIDTSVLISILLNEPEAIVFARLLSTADSLNLSSVSYYEASVVMFSRKKEAGVKDLEKLINNFQIEIISFDSNQAELSFKAYQKYGKGFHKAGLNFADCASYALAKHMDEPLLFKGNDFTCTDIKDARDDAD